MIVQIAINKTNDITCKSINIMIVMPLDLKKKRSVYQNLYNF